MATSIYILRWAIGLLMLASYAGASSIGVCYGRDADNLPSPYKVAQLLQAETIYKVRLFNPDIDILKAFTNTQIQIIVGIPNSDIPYLSENLDNAKSWVDTFITPLYELKNLRDGIVFLLGVTGLSTEQCKRLTIAVEELSIDIFEVFTEVALGVILTAFGVVIASIGDFTFDFISYIMALTSVFFQTAYLVLVEKSGAQDGMKSTELMFYNAVLSLPFLLILVCVTGEVKLAVPLLLEKE